MPTQIAIARDFRIGDVVLIPSTFPNPGGFPAMAA
jgi:hypothetical protein